LVAHIEGESRLKVFDNRALRRIIGPKRARKQGSGENNIMRSLTICIPHPTLFRR
jgi:hypothetical protein